MHFAFLKRDKNLSKTPGFWNVKFNIWINFNLIRCFKKNWLSTGELIFWVVFIKQIDF